MNKKRVISTVIIAVLITVCSTVGYLNSKSVIPAGVGDGVMRAVFFDVGYNDCALFYTNDASILIGAPNGKCGKIVGYMKRCGIKTVDYFIIPDYGYESCGDSHLIPENFTVKTVLRPFPYDSGTANYHRISGQNKNSVIIDIHEGLSYNAGEMLIEVLSPTGYTTSSKDGGTVVRISYGEKSVLWCANIDSDQEEQITDCSADKMKCNIIKLPSHGSKRSSSEEFLDFAGAEYAVISCGRNSYGHPSEDVIERLKERNTVTVVTQSNGTAVFDISPLSIEKIR